MKQNKLTFESENLVVDYISFNIPGSDNTESIAKYLFEKFNFNSTFAKGQNGTPTIGFILPETNIKFLLDSWNMIHHPKVSGKEPQFIFLELMLLNFTKLFKHRNLIGIF